MAAGAAQALVVPVIAVGTAAGATYLLSSSALQARPAAPSGRPAQGASSGVLRTRCMPWASSGPAWNETRARQVHAKLVGGHKGAVTALAALAPAQPGGPDRLLSAGADGTVALWEPSAAAPREVDRETAPKARAAPGPAARAQRQCPQAPARRAGGVQGARGRGAGDAAVPGQRRLAGPRAAAAGHLRCGPARGRAPRFAVGRDAPGQRARARAGEDKRMAVWDAATWKELARTKPLARGAADALAVSARAGAPTGGHPSVLLASGERAAVWGLCAPASPPPDRPAARARARALLKRDRGAARAGTPARASWRWRRRQRWTRCCRPGTRRRPRSTRWPATRCSRTCSPWAPTPVPPRPVGARGAR